MIKNIDIYSEMNKNYKLYKENKITIIHNIIAKLYKLKIFFNIFAAFLFTFI